MHEKSQNAHRGSGEKKDGAEHKKEKGGFAPDNLRGGGKKLISLKRKR